MTCCCPEDAWGEFLQTSYVPKGQVDIQDGMRIYRIGESSRCIIFGYDRYGFEGGRTQQVADFLASRGFLVLVPDFFRGRKKDPFASNEESVQFVVRESQWDGRLKDDWEKIVLPYARIHGAKTFAAFGTCWGSYLALRLSSYESLFKAAISVHPSHSAIIETLGENEEEILKEIKCPQLFLPAEADDVNVKLGGLGKRVLGDGLTIVEFNEMKHGWVIRGDLTNAIVERDFKRALHFSLTFLNKYFG